MSKLILPPSASIENAELECAGGAYSSRTAGEVMSMPPKKQHFLLPTVPVGEYGASAAFVGEPGLGKSRFVLQLLAAQAAGVPQFCGLPLDPTPRRTLVVQAENSLPRLQQDLSGFAREGVLTPEQRRNLDNNLTLTTLESDLDGDISIDDRDPESGNYVRLKSLIGKSRPEVVVFDPYAALCPDELAAKAIRLTYIALRKACAAAECGPVTIILVCHAKPGIAARASARGADAISYARGNRCLVGIMRSVINLRPCEHVSDDPVDADRHGKLATSGIRHGIEVIFAKSNNGLLPDPIAVWLNPETFLYEQIVDFPHQTWQEALERMAKSNQTQSPAAKAAEAAASLTSTQERVANLLEAQGPLGKTALVQKMIELGVSSSKRNAAETIRWLCENGQLKMVQPKPNRAARYYTPAQYDKSVG